jgi:hypothetical protein
MKILDNKKILFIVSIKLTLNIPAANMGCKSSSCNTIFRSIFSIESLTDLVFATLRKIPVVSGPLK